MENVWNIRENKELYYILPECAINISGINYTDVAIVAFLYYEDTVEQYLKYFIDVSDKIMIYLISSNENTLKILKRFAQNRKNVQIIRKENRGRDVSALLISSKEIFQEYKYVCFVHDKKEKSEFDDKAKFWVENLWDNTLKSGGYIENILKLFADMPSIGLLTPPEPYLYMQQWNFWDIEYERTKALAEELNLTGTTIDKECMPITLGTVFWCRTRAMKKLFDKNWSFEDFMEEPMPDSGTISHAVERILAYLVQDAGNETATVMSETYAKKLIKALQREKRQMHEMLNIGIGVNNPLYLWEFYGKAEQIKKYISGHDSIYLFGAGNVGKCYLAALREMLGCTPKAFLVTKRKTDVNEVNGIPIYSFEEISFQWSAGIIISVGRKTEHEIKQYLQSKNYNEYLCVNDLQTDSHRDEDVGEGFV